MRRNYGGDPIMRMIDRDKLLLECPSCGCIITGYKNKAGVLREQYLFCPYGCVSDKTMEEELENG